MSESLKHSVLVVDDDQRIREGLSGLLIAAGYDVCTATGGFDALLHLKRGLPEVIVSDLNMPQMSGFEFLSVIRRRFPRISVVAMSGAYTTSAVPTGVIADAFYGKGQQHPQTLLGTVARLIESSVERAIAHQKEPAPVWIPRNGRDSHGTAYIVVTCTECLRSFPLNVAEETKPEVVETPCLYCSNMVQYIIDFSSSIASPPRRDAAPIAVGSAAIPDTAA
jgi:CheY-like chemotaxis protein